MTVPKPHFLLYSEVAREATPFHWRFRLASLDGSAQIEAADEEPQTQRERLELLVFVRALEALDQPSRVTVVTNSTYVNRGLRFGLDEWRADGWRWERFGEMVPVKNGDLWQRVDRAMRFHRVDWGTVAENQTEQETVSNDTRCVGTKRFLTISMPSTPARSRRSSRRRIGQLIRPRRFRAICRRSWREANESIYNHLSRLVTGLFPKPRWG